MAIDNSVRALISRAEIALNRGNIDAALGLVHDFVERIITEPICTAQVFASRGLDELCLRIGRQNLVDLNSFQLDLFPDRGNAPVVVYIASRFQRSGGHSRLIQDFISAQPEKNHLILLTGIGGPSDENYLSNLYAKDKTIRFLAAPNANLQSRLTWLQRMLVGCRPEHIYLLNHHQDSIAVAALVPELGLKGSFLHHGDHHLCLGVHMDHLKHIDLHPMGYHLCRDQLGVNNSYIPLTFEDKHFMPMQTEFAIGGGLTTATAARSNKVEIPYFVSYLDLIPQVMKVTGGRHVHIGRLTPWALHRMRSQMRKNGVQEDRLIYIEWAPSVWKSFQEHAVDIYIAPFPYGAGLTLIEAMGAGIPVIMHQHIYSRLLSGLEMAYPGAFSWADPEHLLSHLTTLNPARLDREKQLSRQHYERYHRPQILRAYFQDPDLINLPCPPLSSEFKPRYDEWAAWAESQLSLSRLAYRFAYRILRKLRSFLS